MDAALPLGTPRCNRRGGLPPCGFRSGHGVHLAMTHSPALALSVIIGAADGFSRGFVHDAVSGWDGEWRAIELYADRRITR